MNSAKSTANSTAKSTTLCMTAFCMVLLALVVPAATPVQAQGNVDIVIADAPAGSINLNSSFSITVQVQAGAQQVDLAEVHLGFDPAVLSVESVTPGTSLPRALVPATFDNIAGTIDYVGATTSNFPSGTFDLLTISFTAVDTGTSSIDFVMAFPCETTATFSAATVLGSTNGIQVQVDAPLAITLGSFQTERFGEAVDFHWETSSENGIAGFRILALVDDQWVQLNESLIASPAIDSISPIVYGYTTITDAAQYLLHEVSVDGSLTEHGPFTLGQAYGTTDSTEAQIAPTLWLPMLAK